MMTLARSRQQSCGDDLNMLEGDRDDASSMVATGATANTTKGNSRASRKPGLLGSQSQGESFEGHSRVRRGANMYLCLGIHPSIHPSVVDYEIPQQISLPILEYIRAPSSS